MTNRDPYDSRATDEGVSTGAIAAALIAVIVIIGAIAYGISNNSETTASNPSPSTAAPTTSGQGGLPPRPDANPPAQPSGKTE